MMKNKILGSALMIAGTTIGAGMLAMPISTAGMGFIATSLLLIGLWAVFAYSGLLFVEVYQTAKQKDDGVATLAEQYFGIFGRILSTGTLLILLYGLSVAYMMGGGSLLSGILPSFTESADLNNKIAIVIFTFVLGAFVVIGTKSVDGITRLLFIGKLIAFAIVLLTMLPKSSLDNLMALPLDYALVLSAIPVFFTSFGFHVIMGSINGYLDGNVHHFRKAVIIGTAIPLAAYLLWQLATHGVLSQSEFMTIVQEDPTLNGLVNATRQITGSHLLGELIRIFSALALITSFLGVMLGVFEGLGDLFKRYHLPNNRWSISLVAFVPPLLLALSENSFLTVLSYAGLMCAFYCLLLPVILAWRTRVTHPNLPYRVFGGNITLALAFIIAIVSFIYYSFNIG
ncbi:aromatic amino acid transport family protein [Conservatibacter flavescens]|uniref:Aromatic amino acid permease n=1 Tax=Conservatibacter flavescens TaxID=28161 RepID=A0A2M8RZG8_9PAST|nr:aromatic amino acid transport family protein [Conservatibacter flavescens]PJG84264.1 tyrosine transporter [Conservatibacter flavescens]